MANNLKIQVYSKTRLETTFSVPRKVIKISTGLLPKPVVDILESEGVAITEIAMLAGKSDLSGIIMEVERHGASEKVVVSLD